MFSATENPIVVSPDIGGVVRSRRRSGARPGPSRPGFLRPARYAAPFFEGSQPAE